MNKVFVLTIIVALFLACNKDNPTEPKDDTPSKDSSFFFPLEVGNVWYYYEEGQTDATKSIRVWEEFTLDDTSYVLYGNKLAFADTLHQDQWGRVYKRFSGKNLLWLDFSAEDSSTYEYTLSEKLNYIVTVSRRLTIEYDDQKFEGCIKFEFDVPGIKTEEETFILAPDVGIVQRISAWYTKYLKSWELH